MTDLDKEIETLLALREATREAREAAKDLRAEVKAAREARAEFLQNDGYNISRLLWLAKLKDRGARERHPGRVPRYDGDGR